MTADIAQIPAEVLIKQMRSQRDRRVQEVMEALFAQIPDKPGNVTPDFTLADGTACRIVKFAAPRERDGEYIYGFDVKFDKGPLHHLEFAVRCSGFEGGC